MNDIDRIDLVISACSAAGMEMTNVLMSGDAIVVASMGCVTYDQLAKLSAVLGTTLIDIGSETGFGGSEWTPPDHHVELRIRW